MARYLNQRFGDCQLIRQLREGGFANKVYEAKHVHLGTSAAIKILKDAFTPVQIEALRMEALVVSALNHPHIARLLTFRIECSIPYLTHRDLKPANFPLTQDRNILFTYRSHFTRANSIAWSLDGKCIASANHEVHIWQAP